MRLRTWLFAIAVLAALVPAVHAAPVFGPSRIHFVLWGDDDLRTLIYEDLGDNANNITVVTVNGVHTFTDPAADISIGPVTQMCVAQSAPPVHQVKCTDNTIVYFRLELGGSLTNAENTASVDSPVNTLLYGGDAHDNLNGGSGNDALVGLHGDDTLSGNDGKDELLGMSEDDILNGGNGNDDLIGDDPSGGSGADTLNGGPGSDFMVGGDGGSPDVLNGGSGNDYMYGGPGADTLNGGSGVDLLNPDTDNDPDVLNGGPDPDIADYIAATSPLEISLDNVANDGDTTLTTNDNVKTDVETVWGGSESDTITGTSGPQTLQGFNGDDTLNGAGGDDVLFGGNDEDTLDGGPGADSMSGGAGINDRVTYATRTLPVTVTIDGNANDGETNEMDNVKTDVENVTGGDHNDTITGDGDSNSFNGGDGADVLKGAGGYDFLNGGGGNDTLNGGPGNDSFVGNDGFDTVDYSSMTLHVRVTIDGTFDDGVYDKINQFIIVEFDNVNTDIERVYGGSGDDTLTGHPDGADTPDTLEGRGGKDTIHGNDGVDVLTGGGANDKIFGDTGNDLIVMESTSDGADDVKGGADTDTVTYATRSQPLNVTLDGVANDGEAAEGDNIDPNVENVNGGSGGDTIVGSAADNKLTGNAGTDDLQGGIGKDVLLGGNDADQLQGQEDDDTLNGGSGADVFKGGSGIDTADYSLGGPVTVTIDDVANDGTGAEGDNVMTNVENLLGGRFDDNLTGSDVANEITGGRGTDVLMGKGGTDTLRADDGFSDTVNCGGEIDTYYFDSGIDTVFANCENVGV